MYMKKYDLMGKCPGLRGQATETKVLNDMWNGGVPGSGPGGILRRVA